jgi:polar amino acid transport system substrate-binding protein
MREVGKRLDKSIEFKNMAFDGLIIQLQSNVIDVIAAGMSPTPDRAKKVDFTLPYLEPSPYAVIVKKGSNPVTSLIDLKNKVVAVNQGFTADMAISQIDEIIPMRLASSMTSDGILAVQSGRADAFVANKTTTLPFLKTEQSKAFDVYMVNDKTEATAFAVAKESCLLGMINKVITDMKHDGTLEQLKEKWGI